MDRCRALKFENPTTGGTETDLDMREINPNEDYTDVRGVTIQDDSSNDTSTVISRSGNDITAKDGNNPTGLTLSQFLQLKVSGNDNTIGYLLAKLVATEGIQLNELNDGGNEQLQAKLDINGLNEDLNPDGASDYVATYDFNANQHKKVLLNNLPGGGGSGYEECEESNGQSSTTSTGWRTKINWTPNPIPPAGDYIVEFSFLSSMSDTGVFHKTRILIDNSVTKKESKEEMYNFKYSDGAYRLRGGEFKYTLDGSSVNFKLQYASGESGKTAYIKEAIIILRKK